MQGEPPEDGEMSQMTSRHRIRNSIPGGLRSSTLPLGHGANTPPPHNTELHEWMGKNVYVSFEPPRPENEPLNLA